MIILLVECFINKSLYLVEFGDTFQFADFLFTIEVVKSGEVVNSEVFENRQVVDVLHMQENIICVTMRRKGLLFILPPVSKLSLQFANLVTTAPGKVDKERLLVVGKQIIPFLLNHYLSHSLLVLRMLFAA
jgi:hypothetical protein